MNMFKNRGLIKELQDKVGELQKQEPIIIDQTSIVNELLATVANMKVTEGDKDTLRSCLIFQGVADEDIEALMGMLDEFAPNPDYPHFSWQINQWLMDQSKNPVACHHFDQAVGIKRIYRMVEDYYGKEYNQNIKFN